MTVAIYARVSSDSQEARGTIGSQLEALRHKMAAVGHQVVHEYIDDGYSRLAFLIAIVMGAISANAQAQAEPASAPLIGAPVFVADGIKIGQVADVSVTTEGNIDAIRFFTGSALGFGERIVAIP